MRRGPERWAVAALIVVALAVLVWWLPSATEPPAPTPPPEARHVPDFYLEDFTLTAMNEEGLPRHRLSGVRMVHYADDDTAEVEEPRLTILRPMAPPWYVEARHGRVSGDGQTVWLREDVYLHRTRPGEGTLEVRTARAQVRPYEQTARTDQPVVIRDPLGVTHAVGMRAKLKESWLELLSQVRGVYHGR